ncbi:MAG: hypothetical protein WAV16_01570 [Candidatus Moraniibacteriota bacterium]
MNYNTQSKDNMNPDELRMARASLRRDLTAKKEEYHRESAKIEKINLENQYSIRERDQLNDDIESKKGRLRALENEINRLTQNIEDSKKNKKMLEQDLLRMQEKSIEADSLVRKKSHEKEKIQDDMRDMDREIKKLEIQIREM